MPEHESRQQSPHLQDANQFQIDAPFAFTYTQTSITGQPLVSYRDTQREVNASGEQIDRRTTPLGEVVTVTIDRVVDAFEVRFTLLVPRVHLTDGEPLDFETLAVETTDRSSAFVGPAGSVGALQTYRVHQVRGVAQVVVA